MIWPQTLVTTSFLYTLHDDTRPDPATTNGWRVPRYRYFLYVFTGAFVWYWFPGYIAPCLSVFAFVTWIRPNNAILNQLFGGWTGISLLPITFDWAQVAGTCLNQRKCLKISTDAPFKHISAVRWFLRGMQSAIL